MSSANQRAPRRLTTTEFHTAGQVGTNMYIEDLTEGQKWTPGAVETSTSFWSFRFDTAAAGVSCCVRLCGAC